MDELSTLKLKVARCCRLLHMAGLFDHSGHVSARIPGTDRVLIHPRHTSRPVVTAEDIITVDLLGKLIEGKEEPPSETPIHTCIYRVRPDVLSVAHIHSHYATLLGMTGQKLLPLNTNSIMFATHGVPVFPHSWNIGDNRKGMALAKALGQARAVFMRGHGSVVVADTLDGVFVASNRLEKSCCFQIELMLTGACRPLPASEIKQALEGGYSPRMVMKECTYYESVAERAGVFQGVEAGL